MFSKERMLGHPIFWVETIQNDLYRTVVQFKEKNGYDNEQLAKALGCTPRMTAQLLNGSINCSVKKLCDIVTKMEMCPVLKFTPIKQEIRKRYGTKTLRLQQPR